MNKTFLPTIVALTLFVSACNSKQDESQAKFNRVINKLERQVAAVQESVSDSAAKVHDEVSDQMDSARDAIVSGIETTTEKSQRAAESFVKGTQDTVEQSTDKMLQGLVPSFAPKENRADSRDVGKSSS